MAIFALSIAFEKILHRIYFKDFIILNCNNTHREFIFKMSKGFGPIFVQRFGKKFQLIKKYDGFFLKNNVYKNKIKRFKFIKIF